MSDKKQLFTKRDLNDRKEILGAFRNQIFNYFPDTFNGAKNTLPYLDAKKKGKYGPPARIDTTIAGEYNYDINIRCFSPDFIQIRFGTNNPRWPKKHTRIFDEPELAANFLFLAFVKSNVKEASMIPTIGMTTR